MPSNIETFLPNLSHKSVNRHPVLTAQLAAFNHLCLPIGASRNDAGGVSEAVVGYSQQRRMVRTVAHTQALLPLAKHLRLV